MGPAAPEGAPFFALVASNEADDSSGDTEDPDAGAGRRGGAGRRPSFSSSSRGGRGGGPRRSSAPLVACAFSAALLVASSALLLLSQHLGHRHSPRVGGDRGDGEATVAAASAFSSPVSMLNRPGVEGVATPTSAAAAAAAASRRLIDWSKSNALPPWLSSIEEGSTKGIALVLGQSLRPDGTPPKVLIDRAQEAKRLLDAGLITHVIVSGGDPAGVGRTEASVFAGVLVDEGVPISRIIQESQATTTAENIWFSLRWIPKGTGRLYIVTSDFHLARATYIVRETINFFYRTLEDAYKDDPKWTSPTKRYPRLALHPTAALSSCGSAASTEGTDDIDDHALSSRASDELVFLGSGEVSDSLFGAPLSAIQYIWLAQINVTEDPENAANFREALGSAIIVAKALCDCKAPPDGTGPQLANNLTFPIKNVDQVNLKVWRSVADHCERS